MEWKKLKITRKNRRSIEDDKSVNEKKTNAEVANPAPQEESVGGSREGNAGHQASPDGGKGDRQV